MDHADYTRFLGRLAMEFRIDWAMVFNMRPEFTREDDAGYCLDAPAMMPANTLGMAARRGSVVHRWLPRG